MNFVQTPIMTNLSMATDQVSIGVEADQLALASIQAHWSGVAETGSLKLQISNDIVPRDPTGVNPGVNVVNWSDYTGSTVAVTMDGNFTWNLVYVGYRWVRLVYTRTSGTGTISATFDGKG